MHTLEDEATEITAIAEQYATQIPIYAPDGTSIGTRSAWLGDAPTETWVVRSRIDPTQEHLIWTCLAAAVEIEYMGWTTTAAPTGTN